MRNEESNKRGPHTPNGKSRSSQNSTKHSLRANPSKPLPGETPEEIDALRANWEAEFDCDSPAIESLLTPLIEADRMLRRSTAKLLEAEIALFTSGLTEEQQAARHHHYQLILRYKTTHERSFHKALRAIEQFVGRRAREVRAEHRQVIHEKKALVDIVVKLKNNNLTPDALEPLKPKPEPAQPEPGPETDPLL